MAPGETLFAAGEVARHLSFVVAGSVEIISEHGSVLREVHAFKDDRRLHKTWTRIQKLQSLFQGVLGEVAFAMDLPHTHTAKVAGDETLHVIQLSKVNYRRWREMYPAERMTAEENVLRYLNLDRSGMERSWMPSRHALLEEEFKAVQHAVKRELSQRRGRAIQEFRRAAADGDISTVQAFLDQGIGVDEHDYDHRTPLHCAALTGQSAMIEYLMAAGAKLNVRDLYGCSPIEDAVYRKHMSVVHGLVMHGAVPPHKQPIISPELLLAMLDSDDHTVQDFLELVDVNAIDYNGQTLLHHAAAAGSIQLTSQMIAMSCDVNAKDQQGRTALLVAAERLNEAAALMIRAAGGTCDADHGGRSAAEAARLGHSDVLRVLVETCGVPIDWQDHVGKTATHLAASNGHVRTVQYLIGGSADLGIRCRHGRTALDDAAACEQLFVAKLLFMGGASSAHGKHMHDVQNISASQARSFVKFAVQRNILSSNQTQTAIDQLRDQATRVSDALSLVVRVLSHLKIDGTGQLKHADADALNKLLASSKYQVPFLSPLESLLCRGWALYRGLGAVQSAVRQHLRKPLTRSQCQAVLSELGLNENVPSELLTAMLNEMKLELDSASDVAEYSVEESSRAVMLSKTFATLVKAHSLRLSVDAGLRQVSEAFSFMERAFDLLDRNNDNIIDRGDIEDSMAGNGCSCPELQGLWKRFADEPKARISKHMLKHMLLPTGLVDRPRAGCSDLETIAYMRDLVIHITDDAVNVALDSQISKRRQATEIAVAGFVSVRQHQRVDTPSDEASEDVAVKSHRSNTWASVRMNVSNQIAKLGNQIDFAAGWKEIKTAVNPDAEHSLRQLFDMIDADGSGGLGRAEIQNLLDTFYCGAVPESELDRFIAILDEDGDGDITWEEFALSWGKLKGRIRSLVPDEVLEHDMTKEHWYLVMPSSKCLRWWKQFIQLGCIYYFFAIQARIAFLRHDTPSIWRSFAVDYCVDTVFLIDMIINSLICYVNKRGQIVVDPAKTFRRYLHSGFFRDLVASAPLDVFARAAGANISFVNWSRVLKLLRVGRLSSLLRRRRRDAKHLRSALYRLCYMFVGLVHTSACLWFVVVAQTDTGASGQKWESAEAVAGWYRDDVAHNTSAAFEYILSVYWTSATLSATAAPAELQPTNLAEVLATVTLLTLHLTFVVFMLMEFFDAVVRQLAAAEADKLNVLPTRPEVSQPPPLPPPPRPVVGDDSDESEHAEPYELVPDQLSIAQTYFSHNAELSADWRADVFDHCSLVAQNGSMQCPQLKLSAFDFISPQLQSEVAQQLCGDVVRTSDIFKRCSEQLQQLVAWKICQDQQIIGPGCTIFHAEDVALQMWFVIHGEVVLDEEGESCVVSPAALGGAQFLRGVSFGQTARTGPYSPATCCLLRRSDFTDIIADFPDDEQALRDFVAGPDAVHQHEDEGTYLQIMRAVCEQDDIGLRLLLEGKAQIHGGLEWRDFDGRTALHHACALGSAEMVECLCENGAHTYALDRFGDEPIDLALRKGSDTIVAYLQRRGGTANAAPSLTYPIGVLCGLVHALDAQGVERLLDAQGCDINETDHRHQSALHVAAGQGSARMVELLLSHKADVTLRDVKGSTALQNAVDARHLEVAQSLVQHGAVVTAESWPTVGETLSLLTTDGDATSHQLIELVVTAADSTHVLASVDACGRTPLHVGSMVGNVQAVTFLVGQMAKLVRAVDGINRRDLSGYTAADMAQRAGNGEVLDILKQHGACFGAQLGVAQAPRTTMHDLHRAGVDGVHPDDPGDLTVASRLEKSLLSSQSASFIEQVSDAVLLCSADSSGTGASTLAVNQVSRGLLNMLQLERDKVIGPIDNLFAHTGLSRNGQQNDQAQHISRSVNAVGPSAVQLLLLKPQAPITAEDSKAAEGSSSGHAAGEPRWILWQIWPVREVNSNDSARRQLHVLWDVSAEAISPSSTAPVPLDQLSKAATQATVAIDGPLQDLCTACMQLGKLAAMAAATDPDDRFDDEVGPEENSSLGDWDGLLRSSRHGLKARVEDLLVTLPPILQTLASEARNAWNEPLRQLRHSQAASSARLDLDRVLPATAWHIGRNLRRIEHTLETLERKKEIPDA